MRVFLLFAALLAVVSSVVFTCNEIKKFLATGAEIMGESRACVVIPSSASLTDEPYASYIETTYLLDSDSGMQYEFKDIDESGTFCTGGIGPWFILSDATTQMECTGEKYKYAEIMLIFTSDEPNIVQAATTPSTTKFAKGTHVFVAPEGSLMIEKKSIDDGKETTLQFYTGAGANEKEERFPLMPEKFVAGTSTIIIGPVTTLVIEDDVTVELTLTSFEEKQFISAKPGFSFSLMTSGRANDLQSSRPNILVSTAYGITDDSIAYDSISITGTVKMDEDVNTVLTIDCFNGDTGKTASDTIIDTRDVIINDDCTSLDITYKGSLEPENIYRSSEVIYLTITSNSDPVLKASTSDAPQATATMTTDPVKKSSTGETPPPDPPVTTRRTMPPTSATSHSTASHSSTSRLPSTTTKTVQTTSAASGISIHIIPIVLALSKLF